MQERVEMAEERWRTLLLAARAGDGAAYRTLLSELARHIRNIARRASVSAHLSAADLEDIVQETLLAVHLKQHTWNADEPFGPWVRAITRYKSIDVIRRRGGRTHLPIEDYADSLPAETAEAQLPARDIIRMAETLGEKPRSIVLAMFVDGLSTGEIAQKFSMTEGAVRVAVHRALSALSRRFGGKD
ncbi:MAG: sigma-70 family RNA polymerase sigma factor [Hyphomicrobiales bacterium]|nr:sigma-70 family RNA polymerase sigma factor [Hyphomicrobiales bacterium]